MPSSRKLRVAVVGALGLMASPMAKHWKNVEPVEVVRIHDRGNPGTNKDRIRKSWQENGAVSVRTLPDLVGGGDLDGVIVCCGKNGDDLPIIAVLADLLNKKSPQAFICHMSTVSSGFVRAAEQFCRNKNIRYVNYPLTGGPVGAENASMLILASGDLALYNQLVSALSLIGKPKHFGLSIAAGSEVKLIGQLMVFNGLIGICSGAAVHTSCLNDGQLGGQNQGDFFDFLNTGAGSTRQWDVALSLGIKKEIWNMGFFIRHAVVDAIYAAQICIDSGISWFGIQSIINTALAFSYLINHIDRGLATHAIVREMLATKAASLDQFLIKHAGPYGEAGISLAKCIQSLPEDILKTVALNVTAADFEQLF